MKRQLRLEMLCALFVLLNLTYACTAVGQPTVLPITASNFTVEQSIKTTDPNRGATSYLGNYAGADIGRTDDANYENRLRTCLPFDFSSVPQDATINSVVIQLTIADYLPAHATDKAVIVKLPLTYGGDEGTWNAFTTSSTTYYSNLQYNQNFYTNLPANATLTADVTAAVRASFNRRIVLGIMSSNEASNNSTANITVTLTLTYTPKITMYVRNSFDNGSLHSTVEVSGQGYSGTHQSGESYRFDRGSSFTGRAYTQTINGVRYPFAHTWSNAVAGTVAQPNDNIGVSLSASAAADGTTWQANFDQPVKDITVDQQFSNHTSTSSAGVRIGLWEGGPDFVSYSVPHTFSFPYTTPATTQCLRSDQAVTSSEKYEKWVNGGVDVQDILNHHAFTVDASLSSNLLAQFAQTASGTTFKVDLLENPGTYAATIYFKDPWLIDYPDPTYNNKLRNQGVNAPFKSRTTPFSPDLSTSYGGDVYKNVISNENSGFITGKAIYAVRAPLLQTLSSLSSNFAGWSYDPNLAELRQMNSNPSGYDEKAIVFKNANAIITAQYKAHLRSNSTTGFATASARRLIRDDSGNLHMAYASAGSVWYSYSTNGGSTWSNEVQVNPPGTQAKCPAISGDNNGGSSVYIAYQIDSDGQWAPPGSPAIIFTRHQWAQQLWNRVVVELASYSFDTNPALYVYSSVGDIVYKVSSSVGLSGKQYSLTNGNITSETSFSVPNTNAGSSNPALGMYPVTGNPMNLAYQQGDTAIYWIQWGYLPISGSPTNISTGSGCSLNRWPSLSVYYTATAYVPIVSWTGNNAYTMVAVVRRKTGASWSTFNTAGGYLGGGTEVGTTTDASTMQAIVGWWNTYSNITQFMRLVSGTFGATFNLPQNGQFHITSGGGFADMKSALYYSSGSSPYPIRPLSYNFLTLMKTGTNDQLRFGRSAVLAAKGCEIEYGLRSVRLNDENIGWLPLDEKALIISVAELNGTLQTEPFGLTKESKLSLSSAYHVLRADRLASLIAEASKVGFRTELVAAKTMAVVGSFSSRRVQSAAFADTGTIAMTVDCSRIEPGDYFLRLGVEAPDGFSYTLVENQYEENPGLFKESSQTVPFTGDVPLPTNFALENYPNPFNPSTTIRVSLPSDCHVRLLVYDALGREVTKLLDGMFTAGFHSHLWNAQGAASGIYFVRIQVADGVGRMIYTKTNKLLLMK